MSAARRTVLVVDDEPLVRMGAVDMFEDLGFEALEAGDGTEALGVLEARPDVALLFTDCRMPRLGGPELAAIVARRWPGVRIVLVTGYASLPANPGWPLLWKPYGVGDVEEVVARELQGPGPGA